MTVYKYSLYPVSPKTFFDFFSSAAPFKKLHNLIANALDCSAIEN